MGQRAGTILKHFFDNQFNYACGAALIGLGILGAGISWRASFFYYELYPNHLVHLMTPMLLITSLAWLTDFTVDKADSSSRAPWWYFVNGTLVIGLVVWVFYGLVDIYHHTYDNHPTFESTPFIFFIVVVGLFCISAWVRKGRTQASGTDASRTKAVPGEAKKKEPKEKEEPEETEEPEDPDGSRPGKEEDDLHSRWGKVASLIIMILALYAFGLRSELGSTELKMHWEEVPAILVVFVLAELGVHLVITARRIQTAVGKSSELARQAVGEAQNAANAAKEVSKAAAASAGKLEGDMTTITTNGNALVTRLEAIERDYHTFLEKLVPLEGSGCYAASNSLYTQLGMKSLDYWKRLQLSLNPGIRTQRRKRAPRTCSMFLFKLLYWRNRGRRLYSSTGHVGCLYHC